MNVARMLTNIQPFFIVLRTQRELRVRGPCARRRKVIKKKELSSWQLTDPLIHRKAITDHSFEWLIKSTICQRTKKRIIISYWSNCKRRVVSCGQKDEYTFFPFFFIRKLCIILKSGGVLFCYFATMAKNWVRMEFKIFLCCRRVYFAIYEIFFVDSNGSVLKHPIMRKLKFIHSMKSITFNSWAWVLWKIV